jgi:hypothetical protein
MTQYLVDYRAGGMGNTIVAHVLYACNQLDINLKDFFSPTGDAHKLKKTLAQQVIAPIHMIEQPETIPSNSQCLIEIKSEGWYKFLEFKMGWEKYLLQTPSLLNISFFYDINPFVADKDKLWQDFYQKIKDESWPNCNSLDDVKFLPKRIQDEVYTTYKPPDLTISSENFIEILTISIYDHLRNTESSNSQFNGEILLLRDYLAGDTQILEHQSCRYIGWKWDQKKSFEFYRHMVQANRAHLSWLKDLKSVFWKVINQQVCELDLQLYEVALLITKLCRLCQTHPSELPWSSLKATDSTQCLIDFLKDYHITETT